MPAANNTSNLFEPQVFQAMVDALQPDRSLTLYPSVPKAQTPYPYYKWSVNYGRFSELAEYNARNAKANLVDRQPGYGERSASLMYVREGEYFTPTTTELLRDISVGNGGDLSLIQNAERLVAEEVQHVNDRINNRIEWSLWQAAQGTLTYSGAATGPISVDYGMKATHKATASVMLDATPTVDNIVSTIRGIKGLIEKDGGVEVDRAYLTRETFDLLISAWTAAVVAGNGANQWMTDQMKQEYFTTGMIHGFMGVDTWQVVKGTYDVRSADKQSVTTKNYVPQGTIIFGNFSANSPLKYVQGPSSDWGANGRIGRFAKNWLTEDPSGRQFLIEEAGLPVLTSPDQFGTVKVASDTWINAQKAW